MEIILYISAAVAAVGFLVLCVSLAITLTAMKKTLNNLAGTVGALQNQLDGITRETTDLLHKTNGLAEDIQDKSLKLNSVVDAVKGVGTNVQQLNNSIGKITHSISRSVENNEEKIAQVVQWGNVAMELREKWKARKLKPTSFNTEYPEPQRALPPADKQSSY
ncbi:DUF948 domain-containing protein [Jeotgalibacillus proteolyticus]|uniref:DUF948 domain-containing protein n=1 Tax=Jeotgalibacillus proteolyticus TaxID=2082395 RepID=A0A2S5GFH9_9BACL|nr:DUF948 domain-containing protein [Jeotgalibacillus proteolyticus]PPA71671.1 DUF948 domain-containing protein [Jeotgalibacillus proteolyticus]